MDRQSMQKLHLDRRLIGRKGWIATAELAREIEALPDVSHKAKTIGEAEDEAAGESPDSTRLAPPE